MDVNLTGSGYRVGSGWVQADHIANAVYVALSVGETRVRSSHRTAEIVPGRVFVDYDANGDPIGVEVILGSRRMQQQSVPPPVSDPAFPSDPNYSTRKPKAGGR